MIVLDREIGQRIMIDPRKCEVNELGLIEVVVTRIRRKHVRLGVKAPRAIPVHRQEVYEAMQGEDQ